MPKRDRNNPSWPGSRHDQESTLKQPPFVIRLDPNVTQPSATLPSGQPKPQPQPQPAPGPHRQRNLVLTVIGIILLIGLIGGGGYYLGRKSTGTQGGHTTLLPTKTATQPTSATTCDGIMQFAHAGAPAIASTTFTPVQFPAGTVALAPQSTESDGAQYRIFTACTNNIASTADLQTAYQNSLQGWTTTTPQHEQQAGIFFGQGCGDSGCWKATDGANSAPPATQYLNLENAHIDGNVAEYTARLTIAPLFHEADTISLGAHFTLEHTGLDDFAWQSGNILHPDNNSAATALTGINYDTATYAYITGTYLKQHQIGTQDIPISANSAIILKDDRGHYAKIFIQGITGNQLAFQYVVYPYGF